jgi:hypothetical protein
MITDTHINFGIFRCRKLSLECAKEFDGTLIGRVERNVGRGLPLF